jgi:4-hydroxybenzoyl-CoA reductase subunit beta
VLRLPAFAYAAPESVEDVLAALAERPGRARLLAGGTDLLPNLKHGIEEAEVLVSLKRVPGLAGVRELGDGSLELGAIPTLEALAGESRVARRYPRLARAAGLVAGPHHRRMGTLGGNVCLNTRCVYINQTSLALRQV